MLQAFAQSAEFISDATGPTLGFEYAEIAGDPPTSGSLLGLTVTLTSAPVPTASYNLGVGNNFFLDSASYVGPLPDGVVVNGGGATSTNTISAALLSAGDAANISNFTILDLGHASGDFNASLYANSAFSGVTFGNGAPTSGLIEVTHLVGNMETLSVTGTTSSFNQESQLALTQANALTATAATDDQLTITFANNDVAGATTAFGTIVTGNLVSVTINADTTLTSGAPGPETNVITTLADLGNLLKTVTITGSAHLDLGTLSTGEVVTDLTLVNPASPTTVQSSLSLIDASATTGGVTIYAGASYSPPDATDLTVTFTGLIIKGGSGVDLIGNGALDGQIILGNGGVSPTDATIGAVGNTGETITFGSGYDGAVIDNNFYVHTTASPFLTATINGDLISGHGGIDVSYITGAVSNIFDDSSAAFVTGAGSLTAAENAVASAIGAAGVGYFTWTDGNEYVVADSGHSGALNGDDAVVKIVGGAFHHVTDNAGILILTS